MNSEKRVTIKDVARESGYSIATIYCALNGKPGVGDAARQQIGVDPVQFGCIMILNLGIGLVTPPVGSTLFIGSAISKVPIERLGKTLLPFFVVMLAVLAIVTYWPAFTMTITNMIMPVMAG